MLCKILLFLLLFSSVPAQSQVQGKYYSIDKVTDGDTFVIQDGTSDKFKIRLTGIDAPESRNVGTRKQIQVFGDEAKTHLQNCLRNKKVRLEFDV